MSMYCRASVHLFLDEITTERIIEIVTAMRSNDYAPGTVGRVIVILRYLFNLACKWNALGANENPAAGIPVPPDVQRNRFLDKFESKKLVEVFVRDENQVAAKAILLLLLTGARRNEITHARWEHVDLETSTLFVPLSKSGKSRYVILNADAVAVLRSIPRLPGNPFVFPSPVTSRPCASLYFPWQRIRTKAGLEDVRLHDLRALVCKRTRKWPGAVLPTRFALLAVLSNEKPPAVSRRGLLFTHPRSRDQG